MKYSIQTMLILSCALFGANQISAAAAEAACTDDWYRTIDKQVATGDSQGHGPDIGSDEWKSVVEFKLNVRGRSDVPKRDTDAWCGYIQRLVNARANPKQPSFDCAKSNSGSIESLICGDPDIAMLDRKLSEVYAAASERATNERPPRLQTEQRGWIKGRDECWKSDNRRDCVRREYMTRIAEMQARYRLVDGVGPMIYVCNGNDRDQVAVTYFRTDPATLIAERGDAVSLMYLQSNGGTAQYQGRNESLSEHQDEVRIVWGYGAADMHCKKQSK